MVEKKQLKLDDPIEKFLLHLKLPESGGQKITFRHLSSHTSGLPRLPDNLHPKDTQNPYADYTAQNLYECLARTSLMRIPGKSFAYSNLGMGLLGHILSVYAQKNYDQLIQDVIADSLHMKNTKISLTRNMKKQFATGHCQGKRVKHWEMSSLAGAGALRSNIQDMSNFLLANMGLFNSKTVEILRKCQAKQFTISPTEQVGLGWIITTINHSEIIWHNGGTGGFRSFIGFNLESQKGIVILSNSADEWPDELGFHFLEQIAF